MKDHPLFTKLLSLEFPVEDYAVWGSGPMYAHGLRDQVHDIDLIARGKAWQKAESLGEAVKPQLGDGQVIRLFDDEIEIFDSWAPGEWDIDQLIDEAEVIEGIKFVQLEQVLAWKKLMGREKDIADIAKIEKYLSTDKK